MGPRTYFRARIGPTALATYQARSFFPMRGCAFSSLTHTEKCESLHFKGTSRCANAKRFTRAGFGRNRCRRLIARERKVSFREESSSGGYIPGAGRRHLNMRAFSPARKNSATPTAPTLKLSRRIARLIIAAFHPTPRNVSRELAIKAWPPRFTSR